MALYTPPVWQNHGQIEGLLRFYVDTYKAVYKLGGTWYSTTSPDDDVLAQADYVFRVPTQVSAEIAAELTLFGEGTVS